MKKDLKQKIQLSFNRSYETHDRYCAIQNKICEQSIKLLLKFSNQFEKISDFACGTGESTKRLINNVRYDTCYAIDFAETLLNVAKTKFRSNVKPILCDFDELIFDEKYLDLVFCNMGLQWSLNLTSTLDKFNFYIII